ncbi:UpxY family transcription antiterminator [Candidatus Magnetominusculus dajiuhuensis]|uniref:UpxY family transcription antiterminator n=1 Tax=Candidatus Magnetominusculus dajiuhuensis TaxID=3137712 RepID=UPI003B43A167
MRTENGSGLLWYCVYVRPRHEFKVLERLVKAQKEAFLPSVHRLSKWKDRKKLVEFPLFPNYLFVRSIDGPEDKRLVLQTQGVVCFVGSNHGGCGYESVPDEQIASLMKIIESKETVNPYPFLMEGHKVRVKRGPFAGVDGLLVKKKGLHKLVVLIDMLQQGVSVEIDASDVDAV